METIPLWISVWIRVEGWGYPGTGGGVPPRHSLGIQAVWRLLAFPSGTYPSSFPLGGIRAAWGPSVGLLAEFTKFAMSLGKLPLIPREQG
jgi:hypothetical protein